MLSYTFPSFKGEMYLGPGDGRTITYPWAVLVKLERRRKEPAVDEGDGVGEFGIVTSPGPGRPCFFRFCLRCVRGLWGVTDLRERGTLNV